MPGTETGSRPLAGWGRAGGGGRCTTPRGLALAHAWPFLQPLQCLKVLTMSGWNPPPGNRKMHGDLMYLFVITAEDRQVSITASTRGFYLNQ